jgi:hypothetical protein
VVWAADEPAWLRLSVFSAAQSGIPASSRERKTRLQQTSVKRPPLIDRSDRLKRRRYRGSLRRTIMDACLNVAQRD